MLYKEVLELVTIINISASCALETNKLVNTYTYAARTACCLSSWWTPPHRGHEGLLLLLLYYYYITITSFMIQMFEMAEWNIFKYYLALLRLVLLLLCSSNSTAVYEIELYYVTIILLLEVKYLHHMPHATWHMPHTYLVHICGLASSVHATWLYFKKRFKEAGLIGQLRRGGGRLIITALLFLLMSAG